VECPQCSGPSRVLESRPADDGAAVRRRRECSGCGARFTTFERASVDRLYVRKRDHRREPFDAEKLGAALVRAAHKREVSTSQIHGIVAAVEKEATASGGEIAAERIGEICLGGLHDLDPGAYLQFAGTLPGANADFAAVEGVESEVSSVRAPREDAESILKAGTRRGSDE
jgi:transcriptional repressor NrdR